ncbi:MAG: GumC family protein [Nodosilinea sp.]
MSTRESIDINLQHVNRSVRESGLLAAGAFAACVALAAFATTQLTPKYTADAKLLFTKVDRAAALSGIGDTTSGQLQSLLVDQTPLTTQMEVIRSRPLLQQTIDVLELKDSNGEPLTPEALNQSLELGIIGGTDVIEILYTNPDPEISASVVNTLIDGYREQSIVDNRAESREAKEFLLAQLPQTEATVRQADADLRNFLEQNGIGVLEEEATSLVNRIETLSGEIATVESDLQSAATQAQTLQNKLQLSPQEALLVGNLSQNPGVQEAILSLQTVERELASQQARFSADSPVVRQLLTEQASLQNYLQQQISIAGGSPSLSNSMIQANPGQATIMQALIQTFLDTEVEYTGLSQQLEVLKGYQSEYQRRLTTVPALSAEQRSLERRLTVAEQTYSALLTRLQELQVQENETNFNTRIIQPATVPLEADSGSKLKVIALGVMGGALLAIAIIVISEVLRSSPQIGSGGGGKVGGKMSDFDAIPSGTREK